VTLEPVFNVVNAVDFAPELSIDSFSSGGVPCLLKVKAEAEVSGSGESAEVSPLRPPERSSAPQLSCTSSSAILKRSQNTVASISSPSITVRMSFMTFYWVLLGFTGFYRVFLGSADSQTMTIARNAIGSFLPRIDQLQWASAGFTGFYWVLLGFTGFYRVFLGSADSQTMSMARNATGSFLPRIDQLQWALAGFTGFYRVVPSFLGLSRFSNDEHCPERHRVVPSKVLPIAMGMNGFHLVLVGFTGFYCFFLGFTGLYRVFLSFLLGFVEFETIGIDRNAT